MEPDGAGGWRKRKGRAPEGYFTLDGWRLREEATRRVREREGELAAQAAEASAARDGSTFDAIAADWLDSLRSRGAKPSTLKDYAYYLRSPGETPKRGTAQPKARLMRAFGGRRIDTITADEIADFLDDGLTDRLHQQHLKILRSIFKFAIDRGRCTLSRNPAEVIPNRRTGSPPLRRCFTIAEVEAVAEVLASGGHRPERVAVGDGEREWRAVADAQAGELARFLLYTGMRLGEALALRWDCVFIEAADDPHIVIRRNLSAGEESTPKTRQARTVGAVPQVVELLTRLRARGTFLDGGDLVFAGRTGGYLDRGHFRRSWQRACVVAGVEYRSPHMLRHTAASLIAEALGRTVARDVLGHAPRDVTDRYTHALSKARSGAALSVAFPRVRDAALDRSEVQLA